MRRPRQPTLNTHLGEVRWYACVFFGTLEFIAQDMLGMLPSPPETRYRDFLNTKVHDAGYLWEFFREIRLKDGRLGLQLEADNMCGFTLALIETHFQYGDVISDEEFIRFVNDFVAYARSRPIVDSSKREGATITDEEILETRNTPDMHGNVWVDTPDVVHEECGVPYWQWQESLEYLKHPDEE